MNCKLFAHKGFLQSNPKLKDNTIKSLENAIKNNFTGVELDIWYIDGQFILNHDKPRASAEKYDKLADFFLIAPAYLEIWLDFKNLDQNNIKNACQDLAKIISKTRIRRENLIFVPCLNKVNVQNNAIIYQEIRKNIDHNCRIGAFLSKIHQNNLVKYRQKLDNLKIKNLSIHHKIIDEKFSLIFQGIELMAWTVNEKSELKRLEKLGVKAVATDKITND